MIKLYLDRIDLENLVKGTTPHYNLFDNILLKKAGFRYNESYGTTKWSTLDTLTELELLSLYKLCKGNYN